MRKKVDLRVNDKAGLRGNRGLRSLEAEPLKTCEAKNGLSGFFTASCHRKSGAAGPSASRPRVQCKRKKANSPDTAWAIANWPVNGSPCWVR